MRMPVYAPGLPLSQPGPELFEPTPRLGGHEVRAEICSGADEKQWGKCKKRSVVYEHECITCKDRMREGLRDGPPKLINKNGGEQNEREKIVKKRKIENRENSMVKEKERGEKEGAEFKYIGESSRSGYERFKEHRGKFENL